jgi:DNA-binding NarL/FixJ family response regulator
VTIRVLLVDDEDLVRAGLELILSAEDDLEVVGQAGSGAEAVDLAERCRPDVVLMDIRMPGMDGLEAARRILRQPDNPARVVVLTTFDLDEYVFEAFRAGVSGFLLKDASRARIVDGIRSVASGEALLAPTVTRRMIERFTAAPGRSIRRPRELDSLTSREAEVLVLVAQGLSNVDIAGRLFLSESTVKTHVSRMLAKLGVTDRVQAVVLAYESGVVAPGEAERTERGAWHR